MTDKHSCISDSMDREQKQNCGKCPNYMTDEVAQVRPDNDLAQRSGDKAREEELVCERTPHLCDQRGQLHHTPFHLLPWALLLLSGICA